MDSQDDMFDAIEACYDKLKKYYDISSEICTAATILDPRFKTSAYEDDRDPSSVDVRKVTGSHIRSGVPGHCRYQTRARYCFHLHCLGLQSDHQL